VGRRDFLSSIPHFNIFFNYFSSQTPSSIQWIREKRQLKVGSGLMPCAMSVRQNDGLRSWSSGSPLRRMSWIVNILRYRQRRACNDHTLYRQLYTPKSCQDTIREHDAIYRDHEKVNLGKDFAGIN
jgi:hypothetical protein